MSGKLAVVTGASSGIGAETAVALGYAGWQVVMVARGKPALEAVAQRIIDSKGFARIEVCDAANSDAVSRMATRTATDLGTPDLVVNCAGAGRWLYAHETPPKEADDMFGAPFKAAWNTTTAFLPGMLARNSGHLIHVGSPVSRIVWPGCTAYAAARWALRGLNESLNADLAGTGVHSSHVVFGKVLSGYFTNNPGTEEWLPRVAAIIPTLTPADCAQHILDVVHAPSKEPVFPMMLRLFYLSERLFPWLTGPLTQIGRRPIPRQLPPG
jgi:NADP-dependent 3-hydroxy acid dehydrogenase YdfG